MSAKAPKARAAGKIEGMSFYEALREGAQRAARENAALPKAPRKGAAEAVRRKAQTPVALTPEEFLARATPAAAQKRRRTKVA